MYQQKSNYSTEQKIFSYRAKIHFYSCNDSSSKNPFLIVHLIRNLKKCATPMELHGPRKVQTRRFVLVFRMVFIVLRSVAAFQGLCLFQTKLRLLNDVTWNSATSYKKSLSFFDFKIGYENHAIYISQVL